MSRILLVDDSPHAQRMGERILSDEGYEVVTVSNADSALIRLEDVDPDVVVADTVMPGRTGYDICQYLKMSPRHRHVRVILTAGAQEPIDEARARRGPGRRHDREAVRGQRPAGGRETAGGSGRRGIGGRAGVPGGSAGRGRAKPVAAPFVAVVDAEQVRAAVTVALDATMGTLADEVARRVLAALNASKPEAQPASLRPEPPQPALPPPARGMVRRVTPLRVRTGSILGLDIDNLEPEDPDSEPPE